MEKLQALRPGENALTWAFRFLQSIPNVVVTLSGMSSLEQMMDNIHTFETNSPLSKVEMDTLLSIADGMLAGTLPCTACRLYWVPKLRKSMSPAD